MVKMITDFETWVHDIGDERIFRMWEKRTPGDWTPYEMDKKFEDESHLVAEECSYIKIAEVIELPDKDVLIGYYSTWDLPFEESEFEHMYYLKLSQMELAYFEHDQHIGEGEE